MNKELNDLIIRWNQLKESKKYLEEYRDVLENPLSELSKPFPAAWEDYHKMVVSVEQEIGNAEARMKIILAK